MKNQKNKIKAVIFDMDGVISDTTKFHARIEHEILTNHGINISLEEVTLLYPGIKSTVVFEKEFTKHNIKADITELGKKKWERMYELTKNNITPLTGVISFIKNLYNNKYQLAVASASNHRFINLVLEELQILNNFKIIVSADEVTHGKPNPDIFLLAAKRLGISPENCLVMEDAVNGIIAAKAAGMKCIAITTTHKSSDLAQADKIIHSFDELTIETIQSL